MASAADRRAKLASSETDGDVSGASALTVVLVAIGGPTSTGIAAATSPGDVSSCGLPSWVRWYSGIVGRSSSGSANKPASVSDGVSAANDAGGASASRSAGATMVVSGDSAAITAGSTATD